VHAFAYESGVLLLIYLVLLAVKAFAMVDAVVRPAAAYPAADKLTKPAWLWILGLSLAAHVVWASPLNFLSLAGTIAALVYLLDARPALVAVTRRR
jgi:hypothetical protein